jgi:hypothetical protein
VGTPLLSQTGGGTYQVFGEAERAGREILMRLSTATHPSGPASTG